MYFWAMPTFAVKMASLYQSEVPVATQLDDMRSEAIRQGFVTVLIKLTGNPDIRNNPIIKENIKKADYFVKDFSYAQPTMNSSMYILQIRYEKNDINNLLNRAGIVYWGENRPLLLVWATVKEDSHSADIIGSDNAGDWYETFRVQGKKFGLPLIFPVMDMTDVGQVAPEDVVGMKIDQLKEAGKRYAPDAYLVGNIEKTKTGWQGQWRLIFGTKQWDWKITDVTSEGLLGDIMNQASHTLSKQLVVNTPRAGGSTVKLEVTNVTKDDDLDQLMTFLKQLSPVQQVELSQVDGNVVELTVKIQGDIATFQENVNIGKKLIFKSQDKQTNQLTYEWKHV